GGVEGRKGSGGPSAAMWVGFCLVGGARRFLFAWGPKSRARKRSMEELLSEPGEHSGFGYGQRGAGPLTGGGGRVVRAPTERGPLPHLSSGATNTGNRFMAVCAAAVPRVAEGDVPSRITREYVRFGHRTGDEEHVRR